MATEQVITKPHVALGKYAAIHPLSPLTTAEIKRSAALIKSLYPTQTRLHFKTITLEEAPKAQLAPFLDAEAKGQATGTLDRKALVGYYIRNTVGSLLFLMPMGPSQFEADM